MREHKHELNTWIVLDRAPYDIQEGRAGMVTAYPDNVELRVFNSYGDAKAFVLSRDPEWVSREEKMEARKAEAEARRAEAEARRQERLNESS